MADEQSPSYAPSPAPAAPAAPSPAPPTTPSGPGSSPAPAPPLDRYAPGHWSAEDWHEAAQGIEMEPAAFREYFGPARETIATVGRELTEVLDEVEIAGRPLGDDPAMVQAFGRYGLDRRQTQQEIDTWRQEDARLAAQLGERPSPPPPIRGLTGAALQSALQGLITRYMPETAIQRTLDYLGEDPRVVRGLTALAQSFSRQQQESLYYQACVEARRAQLEQPGTVKVLSDGQRASNDQLDASIDETRRALVEADKQGRRGEKERHLRTLERLYKSRYSGPGAASRRP
jgi:hypothetical protein